MRPQLAYAGVMLSVYFGLAYSFSSGHSGSAAAPDAGQQDRAVEPETELISHAPALIPGKFNAHDSWMAVQAPSAAGTSHRRRRRYGRRRNTLSR